MATKRRSTEPRPSSGAQAFYAFKLGPVPTEAGSFDLYIGMRDGWIAPMVSGVTESEALRQLAKHGDDSELRCEPQLAKAGKKHGFKAVPAPEWAVAVRCGITICMALGPSMQPDAMRPAYELAKASRRFLEGAPWQYWPAELPMKFAVTGLVDRTFEGCIMGSGGGEFGISLYEEKGALEKIVKLGNAGRQKKEAARLNCIAVTFDDAPAFAREILQKVIGGPALRCPRGLNGVGWARRRQRTSWFSRPRSKATSGLTPSTPIGVGGVTDGDRAVTVRVTAPPASPERAGGV